MTGKMAVLRQLGLESEPISLPDVKREASRVVPADARDAFVEDVVEDLVHMDESRLVGLGVSPDQLAAWSRLQRE